MVIGNKTMNDALGGSRSSFINDLGVGDKSKELLAFLVSVSHSTSFKHDEQNDESLINKLERKNARLRFHRLKMYSNCLF